MADQIVGILSPFLLERRLAAVRGHVVGEGRILDYGCGIGELTRYVTPSRYVGVDVDRESLEVARRRHPRYRFLTLEDLDSRRHAASYDVVVSLAVIEHLADPEAWLREIRIYLAPAGTLVLTTPHPRLRRIHELGARLGLFSRAAAEEHEKLIGRQHLERLARAAGFEITRFRRFLLGCNQLAVLRPTDES